jgi:hypothetical protein
MRLLIAVCVAVFISLPMIIGGEPMAAALTMGFTIGGALLLYAIEYVIIFVRHRIEAREHAEFTKQMDAERREREARDPDLYTRMDPASVPF